MPPPAGPPSSPGTGYTVPPAGYLPPGSAHLPPGFGFQAVSPTGQPLASFADRLIARIVDTAILAGISLVLVIPVYVIAFVAVSWPATNSRSGSDVLAVLLQLFGVMLLLVLLTVVIQ